MSGPRRTGLALAGLALVWTLIIVWVNPAGEFMVNDDWSFVRSLEVWRAEGRLIATGWGFSRAPGGPFLLVHLWWGQLFTHLFGYSLTTLRVAVLTLGVWGSFGLFFLLRTAGVPAGAALLGALTLALNPLYLAQSFTFMTDITFVALTIFALFFLVRGFVRDSRAFTAGGLLLVLGAVCTRQIGIVLLPAVLAAWWRYRPRAFRAVLGLGLGIVIIPWGLGELLLQAAGSTTLLENQAVQQIFRLPLEKGFFDYCFYLGLSLLFNLLYTGFLVSPLLILTGAGEKWAPGGKIVAAGFTLALAAAGASLAGLLTLPASLPGNVIFNWGLGPVLLKDTYILGLTRTFALSPLLCLVIVSGAVLAGGRLVYLLGVDLAAFLRRGVSPETSPGAFGAAVTLLAALAYLFIITLIGFRDRYLLPLFAFVVVWLLLRPRPVPTGRPRSRRAAAAAGVLLLLGVASVSALHDFMNLKRAVAQAHRYLLAELRVDPCRVDGGMEFNGYHCYRPDFQPRPGLSWWWVQQEDYLVALGPLPGYDVVRTFAFRQSWGRQGAVSVLRPAVPAPGP